MSDILCYFDRVLADITSSNQFMSGRLVDVSYGKSGLPSLISGTYAKVPQEILWLKVLSDIHSIRENRKAFPDNFEVPVNRKIRWIVVYQTASSR